MTDIFISYARQDQERAIILAKALTSRGWSVFWDRTIPPGRTWRAHIGSALEQARCVVVAWSAASIKSQWVQEEADIGREREVLVPVFFEKVSPPLGFRSIQAADLSSWDGSTTSQAFRQLVESVQSYLEPSPAEKELAKLKDEKRSLDDEAQRQAAKDRQRADKDSTKSYLITGGRGFALLMLGLAIIYFVLRIILSIHDNLFILSGVIFGTIGGGLTGYFLRQRKLSLSAIQLAVITLGWLIGIESTSFQHYYILEPLSYFEIRDWDLIFAFINFSIQGIIFGAFGIGVTGFVLKNTKTALSRQQVAVITFGWAIAWLINFIITTVIGIAIWKYLGWAIGVVIGGAIGGGVMFWCLPKVRCWEQFFSAIQRRLSSMMNTSKW